MTQFGKLSKLKENPQPNLLPPTIKLKSNVKEDIPDAYLRGWVEFYKLKFKVTSDVLIPRPETELLVDEVLNRVKSPAAKGEHRQRRESRVKGKITILDIGTGSGNIAISIAKNSKKAKIFAIDISKEALDVARINAKFHRVEDRIFFITSDLLTVIANPGGVKQSQKEIASSQAPRNDAFKIDVVVTNLPYIPTSRIPNLDPSVKDFEPRIALDGGPDGFDLYRKLFQQMNEKKLLPKLFIGEIDDSQGKIALQEAQKYFPKAKAEVKTDLAHKQRILLIEF